MKNFKRLLNTLLILNILALAGVIVLFYLHFGTRPAGDTGQEKKETTTSGVKAPVENNIAFVKLDTLLLEYKFARELNEDLLTEQARARSNLENRLTQFRKDYQKFQEKVELGSFMSQASAEAQQQELMQQQQELQELNDNLSQRLMAKQEEMTQRLYDSVMIHMNDINEGRFVLILGDAVGSNILYARKNMDITEEVVNYLNDKYEKRQDD